MQSLNAVLVGCFVRSASLRWCFGRPLKAFLSRETQPCEICKYLFYL